MDRQTDSEVRQPGSSAGQPDSANIEKGRAMDTGSRKIYRPEEMIPFHYSEEDFIRAYHDFYENRPLLPGVMKKQPQPEDIQGGFIPYLLYSGTAEASAVYEAQDSQKVSGDPKVQRQIREYVVRRKGSVAYSSVRVNASEEVPDAFMKEIGPYQLKELTPIEGRPEKDELQNFPEIEENGKKSKEKLDNAVLDAFRKTIRHDYAECTDSKITCRHSNVSCVLFPVWIYQVKAGRQHYTFAMNAQTGRIYGDMPHSQGKAAGAFLGFFAAGAGISWLIMRLIVMLAGFASGSAGQIIALLAVIIGFIVTNHFTSKLFGKMRRPKAEKKNDSPENRPFESHVIKLTEENEKLVRRQMVNSKNVAVRTEEFTK